MAPQFNLSAGMIVAWKPESKGYQLEGLRTALVVKICTMGQHFEEMRGKGFCSPRFLEEFVKEHSAAALDISRAIVRVHPCRCCPSGGWEFAPDPEDLVIVPDWRPEQN